MTVTATMIDETDGYFLAKDKGGCVYVCYDSGACQVESLSGDPLSPEGTWEMKPEALFGSGEVTINIPD